jgi:uncharacterized flavoprotein (TIGR03862 family)
VGAGPAGLFAAEQLAQFGFAVTVLDQKASAGRKFLVAGRGGLNLTHSEPIESFAARYGPEAERFRTWLGEFGPAALRQWAAQLGIETFVGTSGRIFPITKQAAPLLRRWLARLKARGVVFHFRAPLLALDRVGAGWKVETSVGTLEAAAVVLALGGASWPETGSDGTWVDLLRKMGVQVKDWIPSNCGWNVDWPESVRGQAEGLPLKNIVVRAGHLQVAGELLITRNGLEGGALYQLGAALRTLREPRIEIDLKPTFTAEALLAKFLAAGNGPWQKCAGQAWKLSDAAVALLETLPGPLSPGDLVRHTKAFSLTLAGPRPIAEAISSAGGVAWSELDPHLMLVRHPGLFCAGEMIDWDAPTGGYLLTGSFTTAHQAAEGVRAHVLGC